VAEVLAHAVLACLVGGVTMLLMLWPYVVGPRAKRSTRIVAAVAGVWLTAVVFLATQHQLTVGGPLAIALMVLVFGWLEWRRRRGSAGDSDYFRGFGAVGCFVFVALLWSRAISPGTVAKFVGETALACALGAVLAVEIWRRLKLRRLAWPTSVVALSYVLFLLFDGQMLGGQLEAPLFPLMGWLSMRLWRRMLASDRVAVKAASDVVFALTLGAVLVLFLVWLANLLNLPAAEVAVLKRTAEIIGRAVDLPWWFWACVYVLLAAVFVLTALGPRRLQPVATRLKSLRLVPAIAVVRRTFIVTRIGLVLMVFLGLVVPPAVGPILGDRIREQYTVAKQAELDAERATAVYQAITAQFRPLTRATANLAVLAQMFDDIHRASPPHKGTDQPTAVELSLARQMGRLQAQTLNPPRTTPGDTTGDVPAGSLTSAEDLTVRLTAEQHEEQLRKAREKQAETAAELASSAVTSLLDSIPIGNGELAGMVREYLDGIAESPLGETFLNWTKRGLARVAPPTAAQVVEPDPLALKQASDAQLSTEMIANGSLIGADLGQAGREPPLQGAVDMAKKTVELRQQHAACPSCGGFHEPIEIEHPPVHGE
jgi:hypothetical protein